MKRRGIAVFFLIAFVLVASIGLAACKKPAEFEVSSLKITPSEVVAGESIVITADVANIGGTEGTYVATLRVNGMEAATKEVVVAPGVTETVSFTLVEETPGTHTVGVNGLTGTFKALKPAKFEVSSLLVIPSEAGAGETITVKAEITNVGEVEGTYSASLTVGERVVETKEVTVGAGGSETVSFTMTQDTAGTYDVTLGNALATLEIWPSPAEIAGYAQQSWQGVKTYQADMAVIMNMMVKGAGRAFEWKMQMDYDITVDKEAKQMKAIIAVIAEAPQEGTAQATMECYLLGDMFYAKVEVPGEPVSWQKAETPAGTWETAQLIQQQVNILEGAEINLLGTEEMEGVDCYVLEVIPTTEKFLEAMQAQQLFGEQLGQEPPDLTTLSSLFGEFMNISVGQWVAKGTYFLRKAEMALDCFLTADDFKELGLPVAADFELAIEMTFCLTAGNYNQPVSVELPPGAEAATPFPTPTAAPPPIPGE
ncbi:MAG TPA: hypothetical protein G4O03_00230 [Dehalococcoidia bacterium]|nr:hypothetical protein [Dehalococcoidia bacterium]